MSEEEGKILDEAVAEDVREGEEYVKKLIRKEHRRKREDDIIDEWMNHNPCEDKIVTVIRDRIMPILNPALAKVIQENKALKDRLKEARLFLEKEKFWADDTWVVPYHELSKLLGKRTRRGNEKK